jgi:hypothetical protein
MGRGIQEIQEIQEIEDIQEIKEIQEILSQRTRQRGRVSPPMRDFSYEFTPNLHPFLHCTAQGLLRG